MYTKYIIVLSSVLLTSCIFDDTTPVTTPVIPPVTVAPVLQPPPVETVTLGSREEKTHTMRLVDNEGSLKINHGTGSRLTVSFYSDANKTLDATLETSGDNNGNIRIIQIISPDRQSDGPFGKEVKYSLTQTGTYQMIIGENMMAGDPWSGEVTLDMSIK